MPLLTDEDILQLKRSKLVGRNKVKKAMHLAEVNQLQVAAALGTSQSHVSDVKRGEYVDLPLETTRAWAKLFGVQVEDLFPESRREAKAS